MLHQEFGTFFVGFTREMKCPHCNNLTSFHVRQVYVKQELLHVPIGTTKGSVSKVCPICENKEKITTFGTMLTSGSKLREIAEMLDGGKEQTKQWISKLSVCDKKEAFKRLNTLKAYSVVTYCNT